ncbi:MAG: protein arginine kinase [Bacillota bacterium]|nr:MAG: protein arginine kinase [Bacillota bacterium]
MSLDELLKRERSGWMKGDGPAADIVLSSRVRLARNLADTAFPPRLSAAAAAGVVERVQAALPSLSSALNRRFALFPLKGMSRLDRQVLVEKHLISPLLAKNDAAAVVLSEDETVSIMVNEEDHLRIQVLMPGLQLEEAWRLADAADDALSRVLNFAYSDDQGYLTTCPTNLGTGMRVSVMMHLPGLVLSQQAGRLLGALPKLGAVVRGMYGEGSEAKGNLFQISNQVTLGQTERELTDNLSSIARQLVEQERSARERLYREMRWQLEDRVCRAYGILTNARLISSDEALRLLSDLRLGIDLNILPHVPPQVFSDLVVATRVGFLQKAASRQLTPQERDLRRATLIRQRLQAR